ncbi:MAG: amino acid aminotransferase [Planctomycetota bacterium]|nr:amino acid aminotransferase [Planctomycetota bacterium]
MFGQLDMAPADPILGLTEAYKQDTNPQKINLGVGVFKDSSGNTPILESVKKAEQQILGTAASKSYSPINGLPEFGTCVRNLIFGPDHEINTSGRALTAHTPGGTGALRVAANFISTYFSDSKIWVSDPTWANHPNIFSAAGIVIEKYPYFDKTTNTINFEGMLETLNAIPKGDILLLHGCCHNPTGLDLSPDQWQKVADIIQQNGIIPLIDFAYHGFAEGLQQDAAGILQCAQPGSELLITSSYSKNFGLYNERVGALTIIGTDPDAAKKAFSHIKKLVRAIYSNPPYHGGAIVTTILQDPDLTKQWQQELKQMRDHINNIRSLFVASLKQKGITQDFSFIERQRGMFSMSGLTPDQVKTLREQYAIYIVGSGRINVAGMTENNIDYLCQAIVDVL